MLTKCKECGTSFYGRSDKKFCSDQCRFIHNNDKKRQRDKIILEINKTLRKNRSILKQLSPVGKTTVRTEYLKKMGFNFRYFTHYYVTQNNNVYQFCYDFGYFKIDEQKTLIVKWQPYMEQQG